MHYNREKAYYNAPGAAVDGLRSFRTRCHGGCGIRDRCPGSGANYAKAAPTTEKPRTNPICRMSVYAGLC